MFEQAYDESRGITYFQFRCDVCGRRRTTRWDGPPMHGRTRRPLPLPPGWRIDDRGQVCSVEGDSSAR